MSMRIALAAWITCSLIGAVTIALPDDGQRIFSFSDQHGPSLVDTIEIAVLLSGRSVFVAALVKLRCTLRSRLSTGWQGLAATFIIGLGTGLMVASVVSDFGRWWFVGAVMLFGIQLWLARLAI